MNSSQTLAGMTESRRLEDLLPDPRDRALIEGVYRDLGQEWAAEILGGMLDGTFVEWERVEMEDRYFYPCPEHRGINIYYQACPKCGKTKPESEPGKKYVRRRFPPEDETPVNPRQMVLGQKSQLMMEV